MLVSHWERILVGWDGAGQDILPLAARVAAAGNAAVRLVACLPEPPAYRSMALRNYAELARLAREAREEHLSRAVRRLQAEGVNADWVISRCATDNALLRELESRPYDLVILPAEQHGTEYAASKCAVHLMREAACPVWIVRPGALSARPKVLAAVAANGPEDLNLRLLETSHSLASHLGGDLHVLSAWNALGEAALRGSPFAGLHAEQVRHYAELARNECAASLGALLKRCDFPVDRRRVALVRGDPVFVIPEHCVHEGIAILVMGTVARTGLLGAILGNTAETIAQALPASIISVKPAHVGAAPAQARLAH